MRTTVLLAFAIALVGCQRHEADSASAADTASTAAEAVAPPDAPQPSSAPPAVAADASANPSPQDMEPQVPAASDLGVGQSAEHGKYLVDGTGKPLYMLDRDGASTSACNDACAAEWPPLLAQDAAPKAMDPSLDDSAIGVIPRDDGTQQVTYEGHPLYHFAQDGAAGQLNGANRFDEFGHWSLLTPDGEPSSQ